MLAKDGWWRQPESLAGDPVWERHAVEFSGMGGAQMLVADFNGDGLADVVTSLDAHGYGPAFFRQITGQDGRCSFEKKVILSESPQAELPGGLNPAVLYGLRAVRGAEGAVEFVAELIHGDSGVGVAVLALDGNGDGRDDC